MGSQIFYIRNNNNNDFYYDNGEIGSGCICVNLHNDLYTKNYSNCNNFASNIKLNLDTEHKSILI